MPKMKFEIEKKGPKHSKIPLALVSTLSLLLLAVLIFHSLFEIEKMRVLSDGVTFITLPLKKILKHKEIYATELLSVDLTGKTASIQVQFPEEGWRQFEGCQGERMEEIGYFLESVSEDEVTIIVPWSGHDCKYKLVYRW